MAERWAMDRKGGPLADPWVFRGGVVDAIGGGLELIAIFVEQLDAVALPDRLSQLVDQLEDGEGLLGRPVGWDLQGDGEGQADRGFGHDLVLRRFCARCSDRSWASLRR